MKKNNIDTNLYNEKSLYLLNLRELRDIGRKFGVPAPATLKKQDLVDYILKIVYGEVEVPVRSLRGRPSSREFDMNKYLDKIKRNSSLTDKLVKIKLDQIDYDNNNVFGVLGSEMVSSPSKNYDDNSNIKHRVVFDDGTKCYLRVREFVVSKNDIEISRELAEKLGLEHLDIVEIIEGEDSFKIVTINGKKINKNLKDLTIDGEIVGAGVNQDFYYRTKEEINAQIKNLTEFCEKNDVKLLVFAKNEYAGKNTESIVYSMEEPMEKVYKKIMSIFSFSEKAVQQNEDVLVVVENFADIETCLNSLDPDVCERSKKYIQKEVSRLVSLSNTWISFKKESDYSF